MRHLQIPIARFVLRTLRKLRCMIDPRRVVRYILIGPSQFSVRSLQRLLGLPAAEPVREGLEDSAGDKLRRPVGMDFCCTSSVLRLALGALTVPRLNFLAEPIQDCRLNLQVATKLLIAHPY